MLKNIFIILFMFISFIQANSTTIKLTDQEKQYIKKNPIITAHNETNWPPFNFNENNTAKGYSIDYIRLLASKVGLKVEFLSDYTWSEYMKFLQTPKLDLIINISKNEERAKTIAFTDVFISVQNAIYINTENNKIEKLEDLYGDTIVMPKDFFAQKFIAKHHPQIKQILVSDQLEALKFLSKGKAVATVGKKVVMDYIIQKNNIKNVISTKFIEDTRMISHVRIGASKQDQVLINILNKAQQIITSKEQSHLNFKWLGLNNNNNNNNNNNILLSNDEKNYLSNKKSLNICLNQNRMPFERIENNKISGLTSEYINKIQNTINIPFNIVTSNSCKDSTEKLKNEKCDLISLNPIPQTKNKNITYTSPYISANILIASKLKEIYIDDLNHYKDKLFIVRKGCITYQILKQKYPKLKIKLVDSLHEALDQVISGNAFACIDDALALTYEIQKSYIGEISIVGKLDQKIEYSFAMKSEDKLLISLINKVLSNISEHQKLEIESKWLKYTDNLLIDYSLVLKISTFFIIIILILLVFSHKQEKLKKKIESLNKTLESKIQDEIEANKQKDETIFKQAKLISMGEMIGNIAHQWRQPLSEVNSVVMTLETDFNKKRLDQKSLENNLAKIEKLTAYMSNTITNFNNFFKSNKIKTKNLISKHIHNVLNLLESTFKKENINVTLHIEKDVIVEVYEGELSQILIILLQNSKDAFINNNITQRNIDITVTIEDKKKLQILIEDNAGGITSDTIEKIFEPYFTTKSDGQGIGLGLYLAKQIVEKSIKGKIDVKSYTDTTTFKLLLPFN